MRSAFRLAKATAFAVVLVWSLDCGPSNMESDRFLETYVDATSKSRADAIFTIQATKPYAVVLLHGPALDTELLRSVGLEGPRLEAISEAAPKDFTAAVAIVTSDHVSVGWFLGYHAILQHSFAVRKTAKEPVTFALKYGGSLPEIISMK
jgi:hypothetical protein